MVKPGELAVIRMSYSEGPSVLREARIQSGCNTTQIEKVSVGLYKSIPTISSCGPTSPQIALSFFPETVSKIASGGSSNVLLYMLRLSYDLVVNDTIRLPIPPYVSIHLWPTMTSVVVKSLAGGSFTRYLFEDVLSCNATNTTKSLHANTTNPCRNVPVNVTVNGTNVTRTFLNCTNITAPPPSTPVPSSMLLLRATSNVPAGDAVIIAVHANISVTSINKTTVPNGTNWKNVTEWVQDIFGIQIYNHLPVGVGMKILPVGKEIRMSFTPGMNIAVGEELVVSLPGFTGPDRTCIQTVSADGILSRASWSQIGEKLVFTVAVGVVSDRTVVAHVPWNMGMRLPVAGLTANQTDLKVSSEAVAGPLLPTSITKSPSVGLFVRQPTASFAGAQAGSVANITVSMVLSVRVEPLSEFELVLNNFSAPPGIFPVALRGSTGGYFNASIDATGLYNVKLRMQVVVGRGITATNTTGINANEIVTVVIPDSAGVRLPFRGVPEQGGVLTAMLVKFRTPVSIGCLTEKTASFAAPPTIAFSPPIAGFATDITIRFIPVGAIEQFEIFSVYLPGFPSDRNIVGTDKLGGMTGYKFTAMWTASCPEKSITFVVGQNQSVEPGEVVEIIFSSREGVRVPQEGIREFSSHITISVYSAAGTVLGFPFQSPVPIGAFGTTEYFGAWVDLAPRIAGAPTSIRIEIEPQMVLRIGETITFFMKGFGGNSKGCIVTTSEPPGLFGLANWTAQDSALTLTVTMPISEKQRVMVIVPSESGIRIPDSGVLQDPENFKISTNAASGAVLPSPLEDMDEGWYNYPRVGALLSSSVQYHVPGSKYDLEGLSLSFVPTMPILAGETVTFHFPMLTRVDSKRFFSYWFYDTGAIISFD
jgi:hypothetical protein